MLLASHGCRCGNLLRAVRLELQRSVDATPSAPAPQVMSVPQHRADLYPRPLSKVRVMDFFSEQIPLYFTPTVQPFFDLPSAAPGPPGPSPGHTEAALYEARRLKQHTLPPGPLAVVPAPYPTSRLHPLPKPGCRLVYDVPYESFIHNSVCWTLLIAVDAFLAPSGPFRRDLGAPGGGQKVTEHQNLRQCVTLMPTFNLLQPKRTIRETGRRCQFPILKFSSKNGWNFHAHGSSVGN